MSYFIPNVVNIFTFLTPSFLTNIHVTLRYRGSASATMEITEGESLEIIIWTRSTVGAKFSIVDQDKNLPNWVTDMEVKHTGGSEPSDKPSEITLTKARIVGSAKIKVKASSNAGRFTSNNFLVAWCVYPN